MTAPAVTIVLPAMLRDSVGTTRLRVTARTIEEALEEAYRRVPVLRHHLCDEAGEFRTHVLCFHNGKSTRELGRLDVPLSDGDEITIMQAITGG
jgi:molybdopterin converting factor small subunit